MATLTSNAGDILDVLATTRYEPLLKAWVSGNQSITDETGEDYVLFVSDEDLESAAALAESARQERNQKLLSDVDSMSALRVQTMSDADVALWQKYRKELLDVPQQANFPFEIVWPTKPE